MCNQGGAIQRYLKIPPNLDVRFLQLRSFAKIKVNAWKQFFFRYSSFDLFHMGIILEEFNFQIGNDSSLFFFIIICLEFVHTNIYSTLLLLLPKRLFQGS